jgi:uncharacterized protein YggT (Ycf19 family)
MIEMDDKLAADEARRIAQHESIKSAVSADVNAEVAATADAVTPVEAAEEEAIGRQFKRQAIDEVVETENEVQRAKGFARVSQVIDYVFYLIYGIISLEIILELLGARESAGFKRFIDAIAAPVLAPFQGLMPDPARGPFRLMLSYIMALVVYLLLHLAVNGLLRMFVHRKVAV